jgi:hypothetical protein
VYPELVRPEDVRFLECDRKEIPDAEAFRLGDPIPRPSLPNSVKATEYAPGQCAHKGGGLSTLSVFYLPENVDAAIECSKRRCDAGEGVGCQDLGWLFADAESLPPFFPARRPNAAASRAAFERGCSLGYQESCFSIAVGLDKQQQELAASKYHQLACRGEHPVPTSCLAAAEYLIAANKDDEALPYLLRGCRGIATSDNPYLFADRQGCALLARRAKRQGDMVSYREYLRLECAFGGGGSLAACEDLGLLLMREGAELKAAAYLRKACGTDPRHQQFFERSCEALRQIEQGSGAPPR